MTATRIDCFYRPPRGRNAAIISSDLPPDVVARMAEVARSPGFAEVFLFGDMPPLTKSVEGLDPILRLPEPLQAVSVVILDERIGGRSWVEVMDHWRLAAGEAEIDFFLLYSPGLEPMTTGLWKTGVACCLP